MLQHGEAVHVEYLKIDAETFPEFPKEFWNDVSVFSLSDIREYHIYHDCGKPYCRIETDGKQQFPNHAQVSYQTYLQYFDNQLVATWILHDMDIHVMKAQDMDAFKAIPGSAILVLTGYAELQANRQMFDDQNSVSYKIKYKRWKQRARQYMREVYCG